MASLWTQWLLCWHSSAHIACWIGIILCPVAVMLAFFGTHCLLYWHHSVPSGCCVGIFQTVPVLMASVIVLTFLSTQWLLSWPSSAPSAYRVGLPLRPVPIELAFFSAQCLSSWPFWAPLPIELAFLSSQCLPNVLAFHFSFLLSLQNECERTLSVHHLNASQCDIISNHTLFPYPWVLACFSLIPCMSLLVVTLPICFLRFDQMAFQT
jgi:hypothetical protein